MISLVYHGQHHKHVSVTVCRWLNLLPEPALEYFQVAGSYGVMSYENKMLNNSTRSLSVDYQGDPRSLKRRNYCSHFYFIPHMENLMAMHKSVAVFPTCFLILCYIFLSLYLTGILQFSQVINLLLFGFRCIFYYLLKSSQRLSGA